MKKVKKKRKLDWKSKLIDLLIVIIGITIAFQLNNINEKNKSKEKEKDYLKSFYKENQENESSLSLALEFTQTTKKDIDSLKKILLSRNYHDDKVKNLSARLMATSDFNPSTLTMENIIASGDFELIVNLELREKLIDTYNSYKNISQLEGILSNYVDEYITPFFFENVRFSDFTSLNQNFINNPKFENIVIGYDVLLTQKISGYEKSKQKLKALNQLLANINH
jgi:hypothetical protein